MFALRLGVALLGWTALTLAEEPDWTLKDGTWKSAALKLGPLMDIRVDGRSFIAIPNKGGDGKTAAEKNLPPDTLLATFEGKPISVRREMTLDRKRNAIRVLDVLSNADTQERQVQVDFSTSLSSGGSVKFNGVLAANGETREYGNGVPDDTVAAVVLAEQQGTTAVPFFLWGQRDAKWPVSLSDISSSLRLRYEGVIPRGGRVALVHWIATAGLDKAVKLERTVDQFWRDGKLVNAMVPAEIAPLVVNFHAAALEPDAKPADAVPSQGRLVALEAVCGKVGVKRGAGDLLWLGKDEQFTGQVTAGKVSIDTGSRVMDCQLADIAAIRGGAGRGREHRLYLRDGSVLAGRVAITGGSLSGAVGTVVLDAEALDLLVLRMQPQDGRIPPGAKGFIQTQRGEVRWLATELPDVDFLAVFGRVKLPSALLWQVQRKTEAPFSLTATLTDGSRIFGVLAEPVVKLDLLGQGPVSLPVAEVVRWGALEVFAKEAAAGSEPAADSPGKRDPLARYCWVRDGSLLAGTLTGAPVRMRLKGGAAAGSSTAGGLALKTEQIQRLTIDAGSMNEASVELTSGEKLRGELLDETLSWKLGSQTVQLPVGLVSEVVGKGNGQ